MKNYLQTIPRNYLYAISGVIVTSVLVFIGLSLAFGGNSSEPSEPHASDTTSSPAQTSTTGTTTRNVRKILRNVTSTRNLNGLTLRINQVNTCQLPKLTAYVGVTSDAGVVSQLKPNEVEVRLDGKLIKNPEFKRVNAEQQPLAATLVIDKSGSMAGEPLEQAKNAARAFVQKSSPNDKIGVVAFDQTVSTVIAPSADKGAVTQAVDSIQVGGDTALFDAVASGVAETKGCSRLATIVLSDGGDTASKTANQISALSAANRAGLPLFMVGLKGTTYDGGVLRNLAEGSGGQLYETDNATDLATLYEKVDAQLKGQYSIALELNIPKDGKEHRLQVSSTAGGSKTISERSFMY